MGYICERLGIFCALICFLFSASLVVTAMCTDHWFESNVVIDRRTTTKSTVHSGLFKGQRDIDWGLGIRSQSFFVHQEVHEGVSFMSRLLWIFIIFFIALGLLWTLVGILTSLMSAVMRKQETIAGTIGIYLWSLLALVCFSTSCIIFYIQFSTTIKHNVLLEQHIKAGFSSEGQASLGYSFYLMLAALLFLYFPPVLVFFSYEKRKKLTDLAKPRPFDPNILMY